MSKEALQKEIEKKQKELLELEKLEKTKDREEAIKPLADFTVEEKVNKFDAIYASALSMLEAKEGGSFDNEDDAHYTWEEVMSILAKDRRKFWNYYNKCDE